MINKKQLNLWQVKLGLLVLWFFGLMIFSQLGIVFNHYIHRFGLVIYIALSVLIASLKWKPKIGSDGFTVRRKLITLSIASLVIYPLLLPTKSSETYLGKDRFIWVNQKSSQYFENASKKTVFQSTPKYDYIVFFNPNCQTCQDTLPKLKKAVGVRSNIAYIDTTTKLGTKMANQAKAKRVPSVYYVSDKKTVRLAYHSDKGTKLYDNNLYQLISSIKG